MRNQSESWCPIHSLWMRPSKTFYGGQASCSRCQQGCRKALSISSIHLSSHDVQRHTNSLTMPCSPAAAVDEKYQSRCRPTTRNYMYFLKRAQCVWVLSIDHGDVWHTRKLIRRWIIKNKRSLKVELNKWQWRCVIKCETEQRQDDDWIATHTLSPCLGPMICNGRGALRRRASWVCIE